MKKNRFLIRLWQIDYIYIIYIKLLSFFDKPLKLIYDPEDFSRRYYKKIKKTGGIELEHQIGRLTNFKEIMNKCSYLSGNLIEFGTWKGFSLLWIAFFMQKNGLFEKNLVGLDGFVGLPATEGPFRKYAFSDATLARTRKNLYRSEEIYDEIKKKIFVEKFLFKQKKEIQAYLRSIKTTKFCFIHIDVDISPSLFDVMDILIKGNFIANKAYLLFDDYNCNEIYRKNVDKVISSMKKEWKIKAVSKTNLTKNFYLQKK